MGNFFKNIFWSGLKAVIPITITVVLIWWILHMIEEVFGYLLKLFLPAQYYFPGLGLLLGLVVVFLLGFAMNNWITRKVYELGEAILKRIPLVKTLYTGMVDLMKYFDSKAMKEKGRVVMVKIGNTRLLGMVTADASHNLPEGVIESEEVVVYLPLSYQIGGYMVMVPRSAVQSVDMPVDKMMRFVITGGMVVGK